MSRFLFLPAAICLTSFLSLANALQSPPRLGRCSPISTGQPEAQQRTTTTKQEEHSGHIKIEELTFNGQPGLTAEEIQKITASLIEMTYDDDWLAELRQRITDAWQHEGYFRVQIGEVQTVERPGTQIEQRFAVNFSIDAGSRHYLRAIDFRNNAEWSSPELRTKFPIADGDVFDTHQLQQGVANLRKAYGARGFINFSLVPTFEIDESAFVKVSMEIQEGKRYSFGDVKILGLTPDVTQKLLHDSELEQGKVFNPSLLTNLFERNRSLLPSDADAVEDVQRSLDDQRATVDITLDFRRCPTIAQH